MNSKSNGFTLLEVLISLVLLTILLGVVYSSFFTIQRALDRFDGVSLKYHEVRTALDAMRREIEGAFLENLNSFNQGKDHTSFIIRDRDIFGNSASTLQLTAYTFKGSGSKTVLYSLEEGDSGLVLLKKESNPFLLIKGNPENDSVRDKGYTSEIAEDVKGFTAEVLFKGKWIRTWDTKETPTLPEVVRISIEFDDGGKKVKLTEYARPKTRNQ